MTEADLGSAGIARESVVGPHGVHVAAHGPESTADTTTLLFVHGAHCGSWVWERLIPQFVDDGWPCVALDFRGHYLSERIPDAELAALSIHDYVDDLDAVAHSIAGNVVVVAHSIGGLVALKHAEIGTKRPVGLALFAPAPPANVGGYNFPSYGERSPVPPFDAQLSRHWFFYDVDTADLDRYVDLLGPESAVLLNQSGRNEVDVSPARVSGPICVFAGENDTIQGGIGAGLDLRIARCYGAEYVMLPGQGHMMLIENGWEQSVDALQRWLKRTFR